MENRVVLVFVPTPALCLVSSDDVRALDVRLDVRLGFVSSLPVAEEERRDEVWGRREEGMLNRLDLDCVVEVSKQDLV